MLIGLKEILAEGRRRGMAIGSFNTPDLECMLAVLDAAEALGVPVILAHVQCHQPYAPIERIVPVLAELARRSSVGVCVHLDHGEDIAYCKRAVELGAASVMIDGSTLPYEENVALTRAVADFAHARGVDVEAELGALPQREGGGSAHTDPKALYTDPDLVPDFLARTEADALAIAFGTAHGIYKTAPVLDMDVVSRVRAKTELPLVMHGGSGLKHAQFCEAIRRGIDKINYYSYMSYAGYAAARETVEKTPADFFHVLAHAARQAMYEKALETLKVFSGYER